ncbi:YicC/YloC family endoribonuclease [Peptostreptococcus porci]|uniref:YicC/YloC family endoribonuclease n=1 Tax=Peptostreptococcus porci TaxID=2652282 RepID=UPI0023F3D217|nr:YicC/YloC family endoribonuclease [Peptostreptococcus porci]MDD7183523.1 YicC family protein [Peptostreptococcus porci]MDY4128227.1 YicC/YloC family endoribonuclease [Peptostreptococcus porci]MDY5964982.1 YicC/YloC family endoribonuclease [Peptostreptococcus porci]MDY6231979.1 YicC/YloC family endoribonuclease [Peptostreptococcus porci]
MAISMTGFGIGEYKGDKYCISIECKTINHKYLDINPRIPRKVSFLEDKLRQFVKLYLKRGRVDIFVKLEALSSNDINLIYDSELAKQVYDIVSRVKCDFKLDDEIKLSDIYSFPDVIKISESENDEEELWGMMEIALENCMTKLTDMRRFEGRKLANDILERTKALENNILEIESLSSTVEDEYRKKLYDRISDIMDDPKIIDENRLAQEVAIFADKSNITEEIVRFKSHITQLRNTVISDDTIGRKLDFLIQEMNRETNTIGSKVSNISITNLVIDMKSELEKIREQIQNIE